MLRLTILLCAGLFLAMQIGGEDRGQKRFGLKEAEAEALAESKAKAENVASRQPADALRTDAPTTAPAEVMAVTFGSPRPLRSGNPEAAPTQFERPTTAQAAAPVLDDAVLTEDAAPVVMYVTGRAVNVRSGPSTGTDVVGRLTRGEAVTVIRVEDDGWARIRIEGDGIDGFMSLDFLTEGDG